MTMDRYMFAIAAKSIVVSSQTFVRQHARMIAPGKTALISRDKAIDRRLGPHLSLRRRVPFARGIAQPGRFWLRSVSRSKLESCASFLEQTGTTTMMTEFGDFGYELSPAARMAGCRYFVHFHGYDATKSLRLPEIVAQYQELFETADGFFAPSQFIVNNLLEIGCPPEKISVSPCGIEVSNFPLSVRRPQRCLSVGRFVEKKSPLSTISAFAAASKGFPDARLDMVGYGPLLNDCEALIESLNVEDKVILHGRTSHDKVRELMAEASIFLQHSVTASDGNMEGLPVAILEAMSSGLAVVSTRHSGIPEAVIEGETGSLVDEGDVKSMAQEIEALLADHDKVEQFGDAARTRAQEHFTAQRSTDILRRGMAIDS